MAIIETTILPWQAEFLSWKHRIAGIVGGLGAGKTQIACMWLCDRALQYPDGQHIIVGKDLPALKAGTLQTLQSVLEHREIPFFYNRTSGSITLLESGCEILAKGSVNARSFRSLECDSILADEVAEWSSIDVLTKYVAPRLRPSPGGRKYLIENGGDMEVQLRFASNPPLSLSDPFCVLLREKNYCPYLQVSVYDNILMGETLGEYIETLKSGMAPQLWPILLEGKWGSATTGRVYSTFKQHVHCAVPPETLPPMRYDPKLPICWALDFNVGCMSSTISQLHRQRRIFSSSVDTRFMVPGNIAGAHSVLAEPKFQELVFYVLHEMRMLNAGTPDVVAEFVKMYRANGWTSKVVVYGDASGNARSQQLSAQASAPSNWSIVLQGLSTAKIPWEFRVPRVNPRIVDRTNAVNAQLGTIANSTGMLLAPDTTTWVQEDLRSVDWVEDSNFEIDKSNPLLTHLSDALGYMVYCERMLFERKPITFRNPMEL